MVRVFEKIKSNFSNFESVTMFLTEDLPVYIRYNKDFINYDGK